MLAVMNVRGFNFKENLKMPTFINAIYFSMVIVSFNKQNLYWYFVKWPK